MGSERLQKVLAAAGVASRRHSEALILAGRVAVNGWPVTELGVKIDPQHDTVSVDGRHVELARPRLYFALNKPRGYLATSEDDRGRATIFDLFGKTEDRVFTVGRLDKDSEGLLLLTNDGELSNRLTHPRYEVEREYRALVAGPPPAQGLTKLGQGTLVEGRQVAPVSVAAEPSTDGDAPDGEFWVRMVLKEGRKREVRFLCQAAGYSVRRLIRVRYGSISLGGLPTGGSRSLSADEVAELRRSAGLTS